MIKAPGQSIQNVSESMGIGQTAIRRWLAQYGAEQNGQPVVRHATSSNSKSRKTQD